MRLQPGNPMQSVLLSVLAFEVIVFGLSIFVIYQISQRPLWLAVLLGGGLALLALLAAATLRRGSFGYLLGWLVQLGAVALGFVNPAIWIMALVFGGLWVLGIVLGRRLEARARDTD
ncbi:DUF4233 domain-containing protein [Naumannella cuiyingiana]|uniref:DUF4233 domain-containing protein n=1 Tax=Naumannella cuiyingiana TaxID=1347891 RepID=A0A7Z0IJY9_9ACTN|nr:DUF4233 domain-containing protein [Naumannella cuiyingiana]NYI70069.1 hypothetical protein [Naumannella cuiyingiana]